MDNHKEKSFLLKLSQIGRLQNPTKYIFVQSAEDSKLNRIPALKIQTMVHTDSKEASMDESENYLIVVQEIMNSILNAFVSK